MGDFAAFHYYLTQPQLHHGSTYNPINESSEQTGDTALHLACLFLEHPLDTIKVLVELGADINLENLQGYSPIMLLITSNTQYSYEALKYFVMRGARIPAYVRQPIVPLSSAQIYALHLAQVSKPHHLQNNGGGNGSIGVAGGRKRSPLVQEKTNSLGQGPQPPQQQQYYQGRPLIHVAAAMQDDHRILDLLSEAGLDPAITYGSSHGYGHHRHLRTHPGAGAYNGETALVVAAAHLKIKNLEWLLNHDLDISASEADIIKAIKVVRMLYPLDLASSPVPSSSSSPPSSAITVPLANSPEGETLLALVEEIRDVGKYTWAGTAAGQLDIIPQQHQLQHHEQQQRRREKSKDMVGPVLQLLEQWTGSRRIAARKEVATKLKLMYGSSSSSQEEVLGRHGLAQMSAISFAGSAHSTSSSGSSQSSHYSVPRHSMQQQQQQGIRQGAGEGERPMRKDQRHLIDQVLNEKSWLFTKDRPLRIGQQYQQHRQHK